MRCSSMTLFLDIMLWNSPGFGDYYHFVNYNLSSSPDHYDCALTSVPCNSYIIQSLIQFDPDEYYWIDMVMYLCILMPILVTGIVCNIFNIIIISKGDIGSDSTNSLLRNLAISDLICVILLLIFASSVFGCFFDISNALTAYHFLLQYCNSFRHINILSLDFITVLAVQRAIAVIFPFKVSTVCSQRNTNIIMAAFAILCLGILLFSYSIFFVGSVFHPYLNKTISLGLKFVLGYQVTYDFLYLYMSAHYVICLVILFTAVLLTIFQLRRQAENRASLKMNAVTSSDPTNAKTTREMKATRMSIAVCITTFIIYLYCFVGNVIIQTFIVKLYESPEMYLYLSSLNTIYAIGGSYNFFLYMAMSAKFRETFKSLFIAGKSKQ